MNERFSNNDTKLIFWRRVLGVVFSIPLFLGLAASVVPVFTVGVQEVKAQEKVVVPKLNVPIPGLDLTKYAVTRKDNKVSFPWIGAYFAAIYNYMIGVSLVAAAVMIVYGGFKYVLSGSVGDVQSAKAIITDAVVGLCFVFGIYTVFSLVDNGSILHPKGLEIYVTRKDEMALAISSSVTTKQNTDVQPAAAAPQPAGVGGGGGSSQQQAGGGGEAATPSTGCPFDLPAAASSPQVQRDRSIKFNQLALQALKGTSFFQRVKQAADWAVQCKMLFGSCGTDAQTLWALAGAGENTCLEKNGLCYVPANYVFRVIKNRNVPVRSTGLWGLVCENDCATQRNKAFQDQANRPDCISGKSGAVAKAREMFSSVAGYPDSIADQLQPGDWIYDYNANKDCAGLHSVIFIEWKNQANGTARVIGGDITHPIHYSEVCLKKACGNWLPITMINYPNPANVKFSNEPTQASGGDQPAE